jgi:hypothetical protein
VVERMRTARKIVRGPKPTRALRQVGLMPEITADVPTSAGVIDALRGLDLKGRRVGLQLYPDGPGTLVDFGARRGQRRMQSSATAMRTRNRTMTSPMQFRRWLEATLTR